MHITVLKKETMTLLAIKPSDTIFEGTAGEGGLTYDIATVLGEGGTLVSTDLDSEMLSRTKARVGKTKCKFIQVHDNFRNIKDILASHGIRGIDGLVLDLGFASYHVDESGRGFTFQKEEPLIMTLKSDVSEADVTALDVVNTWSEESLADIMFGFGGERNSRRIAKAIVVTRAKKPITTTMDLKLIVESVMGAGRRGSIHPATKVFQAIRMAVNDELSALKQALRDGFDVLGSGGRLVVISFHEGEDREVKQYMRQLVNDNRGELMTKKPITPTRAEQKENPRSRSAKLRAMLKK